MWLATDGPIFIKYELNAFAISFGSSMYCSPTKNLFGKASRLLRFKISLIIFYACLMLCLKRAKVAI